MRIYGKKIPRRKCAFDVDRIYSSSEDILNFAMMDIVAAVKEDFALMVTRFLAIIEEYSTSTLLVHLYCWDQLLPTMRMLMFPGWLDLPRTGFQRRCLSIVGIVRFATPVSWVSF